MSTPTALRVAVLMVLAAVLVLAVLLAYDAVVETNCRDVGGGLTRERVCD